MPREHSCSLLNISVQKHETWHVMLMISQQCYSFTSFSCFLVFLVFLLIVEIPSAVQSHFHFVVELADIGKLIRIPPDADNSLTDITKGITRFLPAFESRSIHPIQEELQCQTKTHVRHYPDSKQKCYAALVFTSQTSLQA
jgi:hypothetical protein